MVFEWATIESDEDDGAFDRERPSAEWLSMCRSSAILVTWSFENRFDKLTMSDAERRPAMSRHVRVIDDLKYSWPGSKVPS